MDIEANTMTNNEILELEQLFETTAWTFTDCAPAPFESAAIRPIERKTGDETISGHILEALNKRRYVSTSILRERLGKDGVTAAQLQQELKNLVRQRKIQRRSGGNYTLRGKRTVR